MAATPKAESATNVGQKISAFFESLILLLLETLNRAINTFSGNKRTGSTSSTTGTGEQSELDTMGPPSSASRPSNVRIVPALPLIPPRPLRPPKDENEPPQKQPESKPDSAPQQSQEPETRVAKALAKLELSITPQPGLPKFNSIPLEGVTGEKAVHARFMRAALDMARLALRTNETPVGCVFVYEGRIVAKGMNATNVTRNGTRHAELMAISAMLSRAPATEKPGTGNRLTKQATANRADGPHSNPDVWDNVDPSGGHVYPYGQKLHPSPRVGLSIFKECVLYVTVEPCVMCASLLRQLGIKKVYFGAVNDKFGGTGGVFRIHLNSTRTDPWASVASGAKANEGRSCGRALMDLPTQPQSTSRGDGSYEKDEAVNGNIPGLLRERRAFDGDGGNIEPGYEVEGGWGRDEAVTLLRQFYVQENYRAPVPRKKEGRAARLAAMLERDGHAGGPMIKAGPLPLQHQPTAKENITPASQD